MAHRTSTSPEGSPTKGNDAQNLQNSESEDEGSTKEPSHRFAEGKKLKVTMHGEEYSDEDDEEESLDEESSDEEDTLSAMSHGGRAPRKQQTRGTWNHFVIK